ALAHLREPGEAPRIGRLTAAERERDAVRDHWHAPLDELLERARQRPVDGHALRDHLAQREVVPAMASPRRLGPPPEADAGAQGHRAHPPQPPQPPPHPPPHEEPPHEELHEDAHEELHEEPHPVPQELPVDPPDLELRANNAELAETVVGQSTLTR